MSLHSIVLRLNLLEENENVAMHDCIGSWFSCIQNGSIFQEEYQSFLKRSMNSPLYIKTQSMYAQHCYDATWTLAKALNSTIEGIL